MNGDTIYAWQEYAEGAWGIIAVMMLPTQTESREILTPPTVAELGPLPLVHRSERIVRQMGDLAIAHCEATGNAGRLVKFELSEVLEQMEATNVRRTRN